jgi:glucose-6-phosphate-specific signal transduction histidine kinase
VRYASASHARVEVRRETDELVVDVHDDGVGGADMGAGSGLRGLSDRIAALEGTLRVESPPGGGTHLQARIPCTAGALVADAHDAQPPLGPSSDFGSRAVLETP